MASSIVRKSRKDYKKKFDDFREKSLSHLEDFQIDNIDKYCKEFLKDEKEVKTIVRRTVFFDVKILVILFFSLMVFYFFCFYVFNIPQFNIYFYYFIIATAFLFFFWFFFISPLRTHELRNENGQLDDKLYIKYRGIITPGTAIKKQLADAGIKYVIFSYFLIAIIILFALQQDFYATHYLNLIYTAYDKIKINPIQSTIPALLVIFMAVNCFGFVAIALFNRKDLIMDQEIPGIYLKKIILIIFSAILIILNIIFAIQYADLCAEFWKYGNPLNSPSGKSFTAVWYTIILYIFIFLGIAGLGIMCLLGLSALEGGFIKMLYRQKIESLPPEENVWEFHKTVERHIVEKECFNKTRIWSAIELISIIALAVGGYWTLWLAQEIWNNKFLYNLMIIELAFVIIWIFILSGYFHYRREQKYYWKDPHHNFKTVSFEDRGLGSWKTYYREDIKKRKKLIMFLLYFNLLGLWGLAYDFKRSGGGGVNAMRDWFFAPLGISEEAVLPCMIVFYVSLNLFFLMYTAHITIFDNSNEGKFYKFLMLSIIACFTFGGVLIISAFEDKLSTFNWNSLEFVFGLITVFSIFLIFALILVFFIFPVAIRFDNFELVKKDILLIFISTIILMTIFCVLFDFFLPMTRSDGSLIMYGYPYKTGAENDASFKWENFNLGGFLIHWYGYVWWGFVQQFLFMSYFLRLLTKVFPNSKGFLPAALSSCIFGIIHFPDWPLMLFTGLAGLMWAYFWQKDYTNREGKEVKGNNLYIWGVVHGFGGTLVYYLIPISMSVGPFNT
ncbi:MAG: hypothetical protein ACTSQG_03585 [Promethearchaeota archaeon]